MVEEKMCGNCTYNRYDAINEVFFCTNEYSNYYGCDTFYDDVCEDWEEE